MVAANESLSLTIEDLARKIFHEQGRIAAQQLESVAPMCCPVCGRQVSVLTQYHEFMCHSECGPAFILMMEQARFFRMGESEQSAA